MKKILSTLSRTIQGWRESITSWNTKRKEKKIKDSTCFSLNFTAEKNRIIVHKAKVYRVLINDISIDAIDEDSKPVQDPFILIALLKYFEGDMN